MSETTLLSYESAPTWRNGIHRNLKKLCGFSDERNTKAKRLYKFGDLKRPLRESMGYLTPITKVLTSVDEKATGLAQLVINTESSALPRPEVDVSGESPTRNTDGPPKVAERRNLKKSKTFNYCMMKGKSVVASLEPGQNLLLCKNLRRPFQNQALSRLRDKANFQSNKPIDAISQCNHQSNNNHEGVAEEGRAPLEQSECSSVEVNGNCNKSEDLRSLTPLICGVGKLSSARSSLQHGHTPASYCLLKSNNLYVSPIGLKRLTCPQNISKSLPSGSNDDKHPEVESPKKEDVKLNFNKWLHSLGIEGEKEARSVGGGLPSVGGVANAAAPNTRNKVGVLQVGTCRIQRRHRMENWLGCTELKGQKHSKRFEQKTSALKPVSATRPPMKGTSCPNWEAGLPSKSPRLGSVAPSKDVSQTLPYLPVEQGTTSKCNTNNGALTANVPRMVTARAQKPNKLSRESSKCTSRNARQHFDNNKDKPAERHLSAPVSCVTGINTDAAPCAPDKEKKPSKKTQAKTSRPSRKSQRPVNKTRPKRVHQDKNASKAGQSTNQVTNCRKPALFMPYPDTFLEHEDVTRDEGAKGAEAVLDCRSQKKKSSDDSSDEYLNDEESFLMAKWAELRNLKPPKAFHSKFGFGKGQTGKQKKKKALKSGRKIVKLRQCSTKKKLATK